MKFTPSDWLKTRPYKHLSAYDTFYVQRCRELHELLLDDKDWFAEANIDRADLTRLAVVLGSYFEDFTSEIGIWAAFVRHNQSVHGYPLPFYDLTDYDPDYLNVADLAFLVWKFVSNHYPTRTFAPDQPTIMAIAGAAFGLLEDNLDQALATPFYDKYLTIRESDDFFVLKEKLTWFAQSSYLLGTELKPRLLAVLDEQMPQVPAQYRHEFTYMLSEPFTFSTRSSFSALNATEWFAEVARCTPELREAIRQTQYAHEGKYILTDETDKTHYTFRHGQTNRLYRVGRNSLHNGKPLTNKDRFDMLTSMQLRQWQSDWWLSGIMIQSPATEAEREAYRLSFVKSAWLYDEAKLTEIREAEAAQEQAFLAHFGGRLVTFRNEAEFQEASKALLEFSNEMTRKPDVEQTDDRLAEIEKKRENLTDERSLPPHFRQAKDISLFYVAGAGSTIVPNVRADAIDLLTAPRLTATQYRHLFEFIAINMTPALGRYLLDTYGTRNLRYPITASRVDAARDMDFFWRFYSPEDFDAVFPMMALV